MSVSIQTAADIAHVAHEGQFRRDGKTPYIWHPQAVARRLENEDAETIAVAWLHDVIEDSDKFGPDDLLNAGMTRRVVDAVMCLTKRRGESYEAYLSAVRANPVALKVKVADMLHNLSDSPTEKQILKYARGLQLLLG
jgi:(p)ppGpp synthase/HD superfamily hydrolase